MAFDFSTTTSSAQTNMMFYQAITYDLIGQSSGYLDAVEGAAHIKRLIAVPVSIFNNRFLDPLGTSDIPIDNMNRSGALAVGQDRVDTFHLLLTEVGHLKGIIRRVRCRLCSIVGLVDNRAYPLHVCAIPEFIAFPGNRFCLKVRRKIRFYGT